MKKTIFICMATLFVAASLLVVMTSCGTSSQKQQPAAAEKTSALKVTAPPPKDEWHRFPKPEFVESKVVEKELMGKPFMPGGNWARYKGAKGEYEMFFARLTSADDATLLVAEWKAHMTNPKLVSSFNGYFGEDNGRPVFVFPKESWIGGIVGLPQQDAEAKARLLAAYLY